MIKIDEGMVPMKVRDVQHPMLPETTQEELSRQRAVVSLRKLLNARVRSANVSRFEKEGAPAFAAKNGRQPQSPGISKPRCSNPRAIGCGARPIVRRRK
ncbi:hypothetical protein D3Y57_07710 [Sphingomonas paeninsulae]|uniref:Uncharacterized protein n=1 Tax=Sphingomonas paeninsulae TaxID=2319844 RepID=A0A494TA64_SPHPE|nr:hypothetical protein D3Y57_07710 [Sphingomonas paeninsulae]